MPVSPTFPGIYVEELPSSAHTIAAAPTSIAVFIGYSHPFRTKVGNFRNAVRIFSFTDYEREFGGFFINDSLDHNLPFAVYQFFLNGGSIAYVVGLEPKVHNGANPVGSFPQPTASLTGANIVFTGQEPIDADHQLTVTIANLLGPDNKVADIQVSYGNRTETYRGVDLSVTDNTKPTFIQNRINNASTLIQVSPLGAYGASFAGATSFNLTATPPVVGTVMFPGDYTDVFKENSSLDKVDIFNLMVMPGVTDSGICAAALAFCEKKRAFLLMDAPANASADGTFPGLTPIEEIMTGGTIPLSTNGALYFPYLESLDPITGDVRQLPPSGFVAGICARIDNNRGVWKAPAGLETTILNTTGVVEEGRMNDQQQGVLNPLGVNCLREFAGVGTVVFGARTLVTHNTAFQQWWYVPVRRMALFIEQSLVGSLGWVVFEPNAEPLWTSIRTTIEGFMLGLFRQSAFAGTTPSDAFQVKCDASTTTQEDIDNGIVNIIVAFRPLKPAEFVVIKIAQLAGQAQT
jgi:phage tail sheath protein FI